jgi:hypothetical protein
MEYNKPRILQLSNYVKPPIVEERNKEWVLNGKNNSFFDYIIDRYNGSPTNAALIDAFIDRIYGKGISIVNSKKNASEYAALLSILRPKELRKLVSDYYLFGSCVGQIRYGKGSKRTIAKIEHLDRKMVAPEKINQKGEIEGYYISEDWSKSYLKEPKRLPAFGYSNDKAEIEIFEIRPYRAGKTYYSDPEYFAGLQYAMLEEEISNFSVNHIRNGLSMGWVINFNNGIPPEEIQEEMERKVINRTTGSSNAGNVIISFNDNKETAPTVEAIPDNANHEQWQFWANEARQQLLVAHRVTSPMLFGVKDNTGLGNNANELKEGTKLLHETTIRPKQQEILDVLQEIVSVNKISSPLTFIPLEDEEEEKQEDKELGLPIEEVVKEQKTINMSEDSWVTCANYLVSLGDEVKDYEEIDVRKVNGHTIDEDKLNMIVQLASGIGGDSRRSSEQDTSLFKIRYKYAGNASPERPFCQIVMKSNRVYRYEDLKMAEDKIVNEGFGPEGTDKYSIFLYKGGVNCKHWWQRVIYLKKGNKKIKVNEARRMINELEPSKREDAKWEENPKEVAQIASKSNNFWRYDN